MAALGPIGMALSLASTAMTVMGSIQQGNAANAAAKSEAAQREQVAKQERALGQRDAHEERRQAGLASSRARAVSAAGGGALDPTTDAVLARIDSEGEFNALTALAEREDRARFQEFAAASRRAEGKAAKQAGVTGAITGALKGASSFAGKYGGDLFKTTGGQTGSTGYYAKSYLPTSYAGSYR